MVNKEKNFVSAIVYVHNAEERIQEFLKMLIDVMESNFEHSEIICVNDCSDDKSTNRIKEAAKEARTTSISLINMSYYHGMEMAMNAGLELSIGDFVYEFDSTILDFEPSVIMDIYNHSLKGYDIVSASPEKKEKVSSRMFYRVFASFSEFSYKMTTESFRILSRRVINRIGAMNKTVPYRKAIYANSGLKTDVIKYNITQSYNKKSEKSERKYRTGLAFDSLILFTKMGYSFAKAMTAIMMFISVFMIIYSAAIYMTSNPVAGWTTTVLFLSVAFFGLFGILTVIIKYLQLIVDLVFKRKHYSFESIEKITQ